MLGAVDLVSSLVGFAFPPVFDFFKKKFLSPKQDTPEATLSTLATTKPEIMPAFIDSQCKLFDAKTRFFNRDVVGEVSKWVRDFRALIRPSFVVFGMAYIAVSVMLVWTTDPYIRSILEININSWFSSRLLL